MDPKESLVRFFFKKPRVGIWRCCGCDGLAVQLWAIVASSSGAGDGIGQIGYRIVGDADEGSLRNCVQVLVAIHIAHVLKPALALHMSKEHRFGRVEFVQIVAQTRFQTQLSE